MGLPVPARVHAAARARANRADEDRQHRERHRHLEQQQPAPAEARLDAGQAIAADVEQGEAADDQAQETLSHTDEVNEYKLRWYFDKRATPNMEEPKDHMTPYQRGILHLGAFNENNQAVWHYSVSKILNQRANEAERRAGMRVAIDKLMKKFPTKN